MPLFFKSTKIKAKNIKQDDFKFNADLGNDFNIVA